MLATYLIGVFVAVYCSVASATPTVIRDSALLETRGQPLGNLCGEMRWRDRECATNRSPQDWDDICEDSHQALVRVPSPVPCPEGTVCENSVEMDERDWELFNNVQCVIPPEPGTSVPRKTAEDPQIGSSSEKQATSSIVNTQMYHAVGVSDDMLASVSAVFLSNDKSFAVKPDNIIVGKIRGKEIEVCKGDGSAEARLRECFPTGRHQLWLGDTIDFSWGLTSGQAGSLKYMIFPSKAMPN